MQSTGGAGDGLVVERLKILDEPPHRHELMLVGPEGPGNDPFACVVADIGGFHLSYGNA